MIETSSDGRPVFEEDRVLDEQAQEDLELFGRRPAPKDPDEVLLQALNNEENMPEQAPTSGPHVQGKVEDADGVDMGIAITDTRKDPQEERKGASIISNVPKSQDISGESVYPSNTGRRPQEDGISSPQGYQSEALPETQSEPTQLLNWLERTVRVDQPTAIHKRLLIKEDLRNEAISQETQVIEVLRNVLIASAPQDDKIKPDSQDEYDAEIIPFGARIYYRNLLDRFPKAPKYLARRLAEANWERANRLGKARFPVFNIQSEQLNLEGAFGSSDGSSSYLSDPIRGITVSGDAPSNQVSRDKEKGVDDPMLLNPHSPIEHTSNKGKHMCHLCNTSFRRPRQLKRHQNRMHSLSGQVKCPDCSSTFDDERMCERHWHFTHSKVVYSCPECSKKSKDSNVLQRHVQCDHPNSVYALFGVKIPDDSEPESMVSSRLESSLKRSQTKTTNISVMTRTTSIPDIPDSRDSPTAMSGPKRSVVDTITTGSSEMSSTDRKICESIFDALTNPLHLETLANPQLIRHCSERNKVDITHIATKLNRLSRFTPAARNRFKVTRLSLECNTCRIQDFECSMQLPECRTCIKLGTECDYRATEGTEYKDKEDFRKDFHRMLVACNAYWRLHSPCHPKSSSPEALQSLFNTLWKKKTGVDLPKLRGRFENKPSTTRRVEKRERRPGVDALSRNKSEDDGRDIPDTMLGLTIAEIQILREHMERESRHWGRRASRHRRSDGGSSDYWSGASNRRSRAGSAFSSRNSSLHGYDVYDPEEQTMDIDSSRSSTKGLSALNRNKIPSSTFQLPPPPVYLGSQTSFECDICGQTISLTRKREWR
jgi:hypothetical protein